MPEQQPASRVDVTVTRLAGGALEATNARGAKVIMAAADPSGFSPVELLLAAIAGCTGMDVDVLTSRRAEPEQFTVTASAAKVKDETGGNLLADISVEFVVTFPEGEDGDRAREMLPIALEQSHHRLCTVGRTVEAGTPISLSHA